VAITTPVPRPPCDLSIRPRKPLDDALTSPWALVDSLPFLSGAPDLPTSLHPTCSPTVSPADAHSELGPRSLDPDRPFRERVCRAYLGPDVAYRLLQLHFRHASNQTRPLEPRRDDGLDHLPCLSQNASPFGSGARRRAALRPIRANPGAGSSRFHGFARPRCQLRTHHPRGVRPRRLSDDLRARVSGPSEGRVARVHESRKGSRARVRALV